MPSPRKRIGFLPSEEVHEIIEKLCTANEFSQSKVTGLLVEEALRSRGVLNESYCQNQNGEIDFIKFSFECSDAYKFEAKRIIDSKNEISNFIYSIDIFSICFLASSIVAVVSGVSSIS